MAYLLQVSRQVSSHWWLYISAYRSAGVFAWWFLHLWCSSKQRVLSSPPCRSHHWYKVEHLSASIPNSLSISLNDLVLSCHWVSWCEIGSNVCILVSAKTFIVAALENVLKYVLGCAIISSWNAFTTYLIECLDLSIDVSVNAGTWVWPWRRISPGAKGSGWVILILCPCVT